MHCPTAWGQWTVQLLQYTAAPPEGSGQHNSCNALPHCLGAVDSATSAMHCLTALGALGSGTSELPCPTAWGQWAVEPLQCTASLSGGSGQCNSCNPLPHRLGAVGSATPATHCLTAWEQRAVQLLQCTASLPGGSGQCNSGNALPHCLGAVGSATPAMHCRTAWGSGQCNSCNALPHCLGSHLPSAPCVPRSTTSAFCVVPHCLVLCTTLHSVCPAALLLWAEGSGQCNALAGSLGAVGSGNRASHCRIA